MRYVSLVVAIGLLVLGTGTYTAKAAQGKATKGRLRSGTGITNSVVLVPAGPVTDVTAARQKYVATRQEQAAQAAKAEQERIDREATERFGAWGPDLVRAAAMYGQDPAVLYRVMICESGGDPYADNGVCKGLFQFNPGTWWGTPYGANDIYDGQSQIYAAAWMFSQGRQGEWTCY